MAITDTHPEYQHMRYRWMRNRDCCSGQQAVKRKGRVYLPDDNQLIVGGVRMDRSKDGPDDNPSKYELRYQNYLERAVLMPIAQHTRNGLVGMVFNESPTINLPAELEYLKENLDGAGQSIDQCAKYCVSEDLEVARVGLLVDMPAAPDGLTTEQFQQMNLSARVVTYTAESIVDWDTDTFGSATKLTMVRLRELYYERDEDNFGWRDPKSRFRVLRLTEAGYSQQLYDDNGIPLEDEIFPKIQGQAMDFIPFFFAGAENNKPDADDSPISGIVDLNLSHYVNMADLEANLHHFSGATMTVSVGANMTPEQFQQANPAGITVGMNEGLVLGEGGSADLMQLNANSSLSEHVSKKEEQAEKVGARFAGEGNSKNVTAEAARINAAFTTSTLTTLVNNVSEAIEAALEVCALFMGADPKKVEFSLSTAFYGQTIDANLMTGLLNLYDRGLITRESLDKTMETFNIDLDGDGNAPM